MKASELTYMERKLYMPTWKRILLNIPYYVIITLLIFASMIEDIDFSFFF